MTNWNAAGECLGLIRDVNDYSRACDESGLCNAVQNRLQKAFDAGKESRIAKPEEADPETGGESE